MIPESFVDAVVTLVVGLAGGGAFSKWLLERRQARVNAQVAEATAPLQIASLDLTNLRSQMELMSAAWSAERASLNGRLNSLTQELARKESEVLELRSTVSQLQADVARLNTLMENR